MSEQLSSTKLGVAEGERFARLRADLGVGSFGLNQIVLQPGQRGRIHAHQHQEEVYIVLEGRLTLLLEGEPHEFGAGELVRVVPSARRQLVNRHKRPLSLLALGGQLSHEHESRDAEAYDDWPQREPGTPQTVPTPEDLPASELID